MSTPPPCAGKWQLFDSVDPVDHHEAATLCAACPVIEDCRQRLAAARADMHSAVYGPAGTWAGELVGDPSPIRSKTALEAQERSYAPEEAKLAHIAYNRGDRTHWATVGHRIYERQRRRAARAAESERAA